MDTPLNRPPAMAEHEMHLLKVDLAAANLEADRGWRQAGEMTELAQANAAIAAAHQAHVQKLAIELDLARDSARAWKETADDLGTVIARLEAQLAEVHTMSGDVGQAMATVTSTVEAELAELQARWQRCEDQRFAAVEQCEALERRAVNVAELVEVARANLRCGHQSDSVEGKLAVIATAGKYWRDEAEERHERIGQLLRAFARGRRIAANRIERLEGHLTLAEDERDRLRDAGLDALEKLATEQRNELSLSCELSTVENALLCGFADYTDRVLGTVPPGLWLSARVALLEKGYATSPEKTDVMASAAPFERPECIECGTWDNRAGWFTNDEGEVFCGACYERSRAAQFRPVEVSALDHRTRLICGAVATDDQRQEMPCNLTPGHDGWHRHYSERVGGGVKDASWSPEFGGAPEPLPVPAKTATIWDGCDVEVPPEQVAACMAAECEPEPLWATNSEAEYQAKSEPLPVRGQWFPGAIPVGKDASGDTLFGVRLNDDEPLPVAGVQSATVLKGAWSTEPLPVESSWEKEAKAYTEATLQGASVEPLLVCADCGVVGTREGEQFVKSQVDDRLLCLACRNAEQDDVDEGLGPKPEPLPLKRCAGCGETMDMGNLICPVCRAVQSNPVEVPALDPGANLMPCAECGTRQEVLRMTREQHTAGSGRWVCVDCSQSLLVGTDSGTPVQSTGPVEAAAARDLEVLEQLAASKSATSETVKRFSQMSGVEYLDYVMAGTLTDRSNFSDDLAADRSEGRPEHCSGNQCKAPAGRPGTRRAFRARKSLQNGFRMHAEGGGAEGRTCQGCSESQGNNPVTERDLETACQNLAKRLSSAVPERPSSVLLGRLADRVASLLGLSDSQRIALRVLVAGSRGGAL